MDTANPVMDAAQSSGDVPKKKKRNKSFRKELRKLGLPVPPLPPRGRDPALPPKAKRKRSYRRPSRHRANKAKRLKAAEKAQTEGFAESVPQPYGADAKSDGEGSKQTSTDKDSEEDCVDECDGWETDENDAEEEYTHQGESLTDDAKEIQAVDHQVQFQQIQVDEHQIQAEEHQIQEPQVQQYEEEDSEEEYLPYGRYDDPYPSYELQESYNHDYQPGEERPTRIPWHTSFRDCYAQRDQERRAREEATPTTDWNPADPLGLFDELEGPLDWSSQGLFD
ncbi:hypothetical protein MYU51_005093 [Penicillium brevicompactum]|uniref:uncharacterized protein n=1 Tax=Penicillium brevicompactum TaxID=5074 RepID=UPI00254235F4|nr:uncharacterized protein N7506_006899 [Penicillium brevicompactum]KAJ5333116.1 hypothetical protein N7506_006899 [Penicillium brevicompactum]